VVQWLERRHKDLVILESLVRIPLWDISDGPSDENVFKLYLNRGPVSQKVWHEKESSLLKAMSAKHRSKIAALLPVMVISTG
jgi:hypothetical protein